MSLEQVFAEITDVYNRLSAEDRERVRIAALTDYPPQYGNMPIDMRRFAALESLRMAEVDRLRSENTLTYMERQIKTRQAIHEATRNMCAGSFIHLLCGMLAERTALIAANEAGVIHSDDWKMAMGNVINTLTYLSSYTVPLRMTGLYGLTYVLRQEKADSQEEQKPQH